ncbi:MAG: transglutaminase domain-containing protein [bacterium]|nr:transglutaminase domain-containing protein [bacterium]
MKASSRQDGVERWSVGTVPGWAKQVSNEALISLCGENEKDIEFKKSGKGLCYLNTEIIHTSNTGTTRYFLKVWSLSSTQALQSASASEIFVSNDQRIIIHRVSLIRDKEMLDKTDTLNVRVLDDEKSSAYGLIAKIKKIHLTIDDLRLEDTFLLEYSIVAAFDSDAVLDKKYFRHLQHMPLSYWLYKSYTFKLINEREEDLCVVRKYFRDENGQKTTADPTIVRKGGNFTFEKSDFQTSSPNDVFIPYIEIATDASWPAIASEVHALYHTGLTIALDEPSLHKAVNLGSDTGENIKNIIEFVQNRIVYLYDADVMHGHIPQSPEVTLRQKSGDCKAKSLLLVTLLRAIHVASEIVLVNYSQDFFVSEGLPSPFAFNHVIVKISHNEKEYFVDPTWSDRSGLLEKRAEPLFSNYLAIQEGAHLIQKADVVPPGFNSEEEVNVSLGKEESSIRIETFYRQASADITRSNFKNADTADLIQNQNRILASKLSLDESKDPNTFFGDVEYRVLSDDQKENCLKVLYKAKLIAPYTGVKGGRVFRYYNSLDISPIVSHKHKDLPCDSFFAYPMKCGLHIVSRDFIRRKDPVTTRNTDIDNSYFRFSNKKSFSLRSVTVTSEYVPKISGYIQAADLEKVREDYIKVNDSNFGIGIVFANFWQYIFRNSYLLIVLYVLIRVIIVAFTSEGSDVSTPAKPEIPKEAALHFPSAPSDLAYSQEKKVYSDPQDKVSFEYPATSKWTMTTFGDATTQNRSVLFMLDSFALEGPGKRVKMGFDANNLGQSNSLDGEIAFLLEGFPKPLAISRNVQLRPDSIPADVQVETMEIDSYVPVGYGVEAHQKQLFMVATRGPLMYRFTLSADVEDYHKVYPLAASIIRSISFK